MFLESLDASKLNMADENIINGVDWNEQIEGEILNSEESDDDEKGTYVRTYNFISVIFSKPNLIPFWGAFSFFTQYYWNALGMKCCLM